MRSENRFPDIAQRNLTMQYVELPLVLHFFRIPERARVLDLGCGRGFGLAGLRRLAPHASFIGVDHDLDALGFAAAQRAGSICAGDACALPFHDESFDVVFDFGTSYHVDDPPSSLAEVQRVLKNGGSYIHETRANQLMSHPVRSRGRVLPWSAAPRLIPARHAILWARRIKS